MDTDTTIETWDTLQQLGFRPDSGVISDVMPGLSMDFGNFKLSASAVMSKWFRPVVLFTGWLRSPRSLADVHFELPRRVASREQLVALIAFFLDNTVGSGGFRPAIAVDWIGEGRANHGLLPWEESIAVYNARPRCDVSREWLRLGLKKLSSILNAANPGDKVTFKFDGSVLVIRCGSEVVPLAAKGNPWPCEYSIPVKDIGYLPKRVVREQTEISFHAGNLQIGRVRYSAAVEEPCETSPAATPDAVNRDRAGGVVRA